MNSNNVLCTRELQIACSVVAFVLILCYALPLPDYLRAAMAWLGAQPPLVGGLLFSLLYATVVVLALPAMLLSLAAGFVWGFGRAMLWSSIGATAGSWLAFALGQRVLRSTVARVAERYPLFAQVDQAISHGGWRLVVLLRVSPLTPYNVMNYAMALTQVEPFTYGWASAIGMLPQTALMCYAGTAASDLSAAFESGGDATFVYYTIGATVVSTIAISWIVNRELKKVLNASDASKKREDDDDDVLLQAV